MAPNPLLIFLPVLALAATAARMFPSGVELARHRTRHMPWLLALPAVYYIGVCVAYVRSPSFQDHLEASVCTQALLARAGEAVYPEPDSAARRMSLYGPTTYLLHMALTAIVDDPIVATKSGGVMLAWGSLAILFIALAQSSTLGVACVGAALTAWSYLICDHMSFWNRPDSLLLFGLSLCCLGVSSRSRLIGSVAMGAGVALAVGAKIHSILAVAPLVVLRRQCPSSKLALPAALAGLALAFVPFAMHPSFSLPCYWHGLRLAARHEFEGSMLLTNVQYAILILTPILCTGSVTSVQKAGLRGASPETTLAACLGVTAILGCKTGAGLWHLLPFLPVVATMAATRLREHRSPNCSQSGGRRASLSVPLATASIATVAVSSAMSQWTVIAFVRADEGASVRRDIESIRTNHPGASIVMGYGGRPGYEYTFFKPLLFDLTQDDFLDAATLMDLHAAGVEIPEATLRKIHSHEYDLFLIPKGAAPFSIRAWGPHSWWLFGNRLPFAFVRSYAKIGETQFFDVWAANRPHAAQQNNRPS